MTVPLCLAIHHASLHGVKTFVFHQIHSSCHLAKALELIVVGGSEDKVASLVKWMSKEGQSQRTLT